MAVLPISLVKEKVYLRNFRDSKFLDESEQRRFYTGINFSPLNIVSYIQVDLKLQTLNGKVLLLLFEVLVVSDNTMSHYAILGGDFLNTLGITLIRRGKATTEYENSENDIMLINILKKPDNKLFDLFASEIGGNVSHEKKFELKKLLEAYHESRKTPNPISCEMEINWTSNEPFHYKPCMLSWSEIVE